MGAPHKSDAAESRVKVIAVNRRARFDYDLGERYEAGLVLIGSEVKSLRGAGANIGEAWVDVVRGEAFVEGLRIPVLKHAAFGHQETRARKLLLHQREIGTLQDEIARKGMTIIVTRVYFRDGRAKLELAVAKGRRKGDKRQAIKNREAEREARSSISRAWRKKG